MIVDLPAPLSPTRPRVRPRGTAKLTSSTAQNCPKYLPMLLTSITDSAFIVSPASPAQNVGLESFMRPTSVGTRPTNRHSGVAPPPFTELIRLEVGEACADPGVIGNDPSRVSRPRRDTEALERRRVVDHTIIE